MAKTWLSSTRDTVQPVCEEHFAHEPDECAQRQTEMDHH